MAQIGELQQYFEQRKTAIAKVIPKTLDVERMNKLACSAVAKNPRLLDCTAPSIYLAFHQAAVLGLEIGVDAYLVPFKKTAVMIPDYRGLIGLAYNHPNIKSIYAHVVRVGDIFSYSLGLHPDLEHVPGEERGDVTHTYAVCHLKDGGSIFEVMTKEDIEVVRQSSRGKDAEPWVRWYDRMCRKTVLKQLVKWLPKSTTLKRAVAIEDAAESGEAPMVGLEGEEVWEAEFEVLQTEQKSTGKQVKDRLKKKVTPKKKEPEKKEEPKKKQPEKEQEADPTFRIEALPRKLVDILRKEGFDWDDNIDASRKSGLTRDEAISCSDELLHSELYEQGIVLRIFNEVTGELVMDTTDNKKE
jgi:recombination protein RecT